LPLPSAGFRRYSLPDTISAPVWSQRSTPYSRPQFHVPPISETMHPQGFFLNQILSSRGSAGGGNIAETGRCTMTNLGGNSVTRVSHEVSYRRSVDFFGGLRIKAHRTRNAIQSGRPGKRHN